MSTTSFGGADFDDKLILGSWRIDIETSLRKTTDQDLKQYYELPAATKTKLRDGFNGRVFFFAENGSFTAQWKVDGKSREITGKWKWVRANTLEISFGSSQLVYKVLELDDKHLVLEQLQRGTGVFAILYLHNAAR